MTATKEIILQRFELSFIFASKDECDTCAAYKTEDIDDIATNSTRRKKKRFDMNKMLANCRRRKECTQSIYIQFSYVLNSSGTFASIIYHFLLAHSLPKRDSFDKIILYSDRYTYQNRNALLFYTRANFSNQKKLTFEQKYLEKGHSQIECDSMNSTIEKKLIIKNINVLANYA